MAITAGQRGILERALHDSLGEEAAAIMIEQLPPGGPDSLATKSDLVGLEQRMDTRLDHTGERFNARSDQMEERFNARLDLMDARFDHMDARFDHMEERFNARFDLMGERFNARFDHMEERFNARFDLMGEHVSARVEGVRAEFHGELLRAVSAQSRQLFFAMTGAMASLIAVAYALSRIFPVGH